MEGIFAVKNHMNRTYEVVSSLNQALTFAFAVFLLIGGIYGYSVADSLPSLLGGGSTGILLGVASLKNPRSATSRVTILLTTAFICGFFSFKYLRSGKVVPAGFGGLAALSLSILNLTLLLFAKKKDQ